MRLDVLTGALDDEFGTRLVQDDDWADVFEQCYPDPYWREFAEPGWEGRWNGLMVRGSGEVARAVTCVFPSDRVVAGLEPGTLLFSEHPVDFADEPGFLPLSRASFETMRARGISFYNVHAPIDQHPRISPSRMCADAIGMTGVEEYFPIDPAIPGGCAVVGDSDHTIEEVAQLLSSWLGKEVPVTVVSRHRPAAGRVTVVGGGGTDRELLEASLERGCQTYVTGGAVTRCRVEIVQRMLKEFLDLAQAEGVSVIDATHYGTEMPPQLAMVDWFQQRGLPARFQPDGPK